jgi:uncharacterized membrane protein
VAIAYPDAETAEQVRTELVQATKAKLVELQDAVALIALGSSDAPDKLIERLRPYGGDVIQTSLDTEEEERLRSSLGHSVPA